MHPQFFRAKEKYPEARIQAFSTFFVEVINLLIDGKIPAYKMSVYIFHKNHQVSKHIKKYISYLILFP